MVTSPFRSLWRCPEGDLNSEIPLYHYSRNETFVWVDLSLTVAWTFARSEETHFPNIPERYLDSRTKSLTISTTHSALVFVLMNIQQHQMVQWFNLCHGCPQVVLTRRRALNDRSLVAFVAGMTIINLANLMTCDNSCCWYEDNDRKFLIVPVKIFRNVFVWFFGNPRCIYN